MTNSLIDRIEDLDEATLLEAAQLLAASLPSESRQTETEHVKVDSPIVQHPLEHQQDLLDLSRLLLTAASYEYPELVDEAVAGAGRKQLILGPEELVVLAGLLVVALWIVVTKGKSAEKIKIQTETTNDGSKKVTINRETKYGVSPELIQLLKSLLRNLLP